MLSFFISVATGLLAGWLGLALVAFFLADRLLFPAPPPSYGTSPEIRFLPLPGGGRIATHYLPNPRARHVILLSHGNAEDIGHLLPFLDALHKQGFAVLAYDYPGYGLSDGRPSESGCLAAVEAAYQHLTEDLLIPPARVIAFGRSVGSGPSIFLASRHPIGGLVLQAPFTSAFRVVTRVPLLPWDKFNNLRRIPQVRCPILFIHGTEDEVVPFSHSQTLLSRARAPASFLWVQGARHNDLQAVAGPLFWQTVSRFSRDLPIISPPLP